MPPKKYRGPKKITKRKPQKVVKAKSAKDKNGAKKLTTRG